LDDALLFELWAEAKRRLGAQLDQRAAQAVFLEGSLAEGFGNPGSDVDFVAIVDDGTRVATMPYVLFVHERRVEVRFLSRDRLERELEELRAELDAGLAAPSTRISWNQLERCQRFVHCHPIFNAEYIDALKETLGVEALGRIVRAWFVDFARETGRYAVAMHVLDEHEAARAWLRTAGFHALKAYVAGRGEHYLGSKWLELQMDRCGVAPAIRSRLRALLFDPGQGLSPAEQVERGVALLADLAVDGVELDARQVRFGGKPDVSTWQIGRHVHVVRGGDVFRLGPAAASAWRSVELGRPCLDAIDAQRFPETAARRKRHLADFARKGLIGLSWGDEPIRARQEAESCPSPFPAGPVLSVDGARLVESAASEVQLLPMPAVRFAEAGVNLTWAHVGVENAREDSLGALRKQQWGVLEYTLQRMVQTAAMVALAAHGITPQPPLEEATLVAARLLKLDAALRETIRKVEATPIGSELDAQRSFAAADEVVRTLRQLAGESSFPTSFETEEGWCETILYGYDWFNLAAHLDAPFPATAVGGRGTAEEARDVLASSLG